MGSNFKNPYAGTVGIGVITDLLSVASGEAVMKQVTLTHPGAGRTPGLANARAATAGLGTELGSIYTTVGSAIIKISKDTNGGENVSLIAGLPDQTGTANGVGSTARFGALIGGLVYHEATNSLYVSDTNNHKIRKVDLTTNTVSDLAGSGTAGMAPGTGASATFNLPQALDHDGTNLYVGQGAFSTAAALRKIVISTGVVTNPASTVVGNTTTHIEGVSVDKDNLFVWFTTRDGAGLVQLRRYNITLDSTATVGSNSSSTAAPADSVTPYTSTSATNLLQSSATAIPTVVCDAQDARVAYLASYGCKTVRKVRLLDGTVATPTSVSHYMWVGDPVATEATEGTGTTAGFSDTIYLGGITPNGVLLLLDNSTSSCWAIDTATANACYLIYGRQIGGATGQVVNTCDTTSGFTLAVNTSVNGNVHATSGALKAQSYGTPTNNEYRGPSATLELGVGVADFSVTAGVAWNNVANGEAGRFALDFMDASNNVLASYSYKDTGGTGAATVVAGMYAGTDAVSLSGSPSAIGGSTGPTTNTFDGNVTIARVGSTWSWNGGALTAGSGTISTTAVAKIRFRFEWWHPSTTPTPFTQMELKNVAISATALPNGVSSAVVGGHSAGNHDVVVKIGVRKSVDGATNKDDQMYMRNLRISPDGLPVYLDENRSLETGDELVILPINGPVLVSVSDLLIVP